MIKQIVKKFLPRPLIKIYHSLVARLAAGWYGLPSRRLLVIGVTGTKGKSTTVNMIAHLLEALGERVAFFSTVQRGIMSARLTNRSKMTMPGRGELQRFLREAVRAGCTAAVLEVSSEGLAQGRHLGIAFDGAVLLNLTSEHIEAHQGFRNYRQAKERLFAGLNRPWRKILHDKEIPTVIAVNADEKFAFNYLRHAADRRLAWTMTKNGVKDIPGLQIFRAQEIELSPAGSKFKVNGILVKLPLVGEFNVQNALAAMTTLTGFGYEVKKLIYALASVPKTPGRLEEVKLNSAFKVFVDYAHEPASLQAVYNAVKLFQPKRLLTLLGSQGGGRDIAKRSVMGALAANSANIVFVTNEDPYDEPPEKIVADVAQAADSVGKAKVFAIPDRRLAIRKMLSLAQPGDVLLLTGKGGEEVMAISKGRLIPWDDRQVLQEEYLKNTQ
ncbi:UDP-N-acetylmuramoyl-L-alanyl-D-glutamate--2,6-diaminopimelate ligase [Candidatus Parcubacteria bacterium]|jgi:UDP-N-acetylmuramoyl-L-alanyl-D-glutamate--2,6-diaminopimelate ligase|nr:MAG: UDP-N-acetylmuramoyl-L-alanyl-D-glutamate--2,6-diaminopimelate ligase [Candidatus Parcubacteria bacterium]